MNLLDGSDDLAPPELTFRYSDFVLIGTGGMGRVLGAHDSHLNRQVAIKLLPRNSENALAVMRFQQEAKAVSKLNNPHVVQVLDFGYTEAGEPYLVMEHVRGTSLQSCLETRGALPILESINIAVQLCEALQHAHTNDVIHRDLKPGNIMLETGNVAKVLDFGLARIATEEEDWRLTRPGQPVGSILYMSPEQVRGEESDQRSDIYSLGLVILKMITGQLPFEPKSALEIIKIRLEEEPPVIPEFEAARLDEILRVELNQVLRKAMAFDAEERFANMSEFRLALLNVIERANQIFALETKADSAPLSDKNRSSEKKAIFLFKTLVGVLIVVSLCMTAYYFVSKKRAEDEKRLSKKHPVIVTASDEKIREQILSKREEMIKNKFVIHGDREHGLWRANETVTDADILQLVGIPISQFTFEDNEKISHKGMETLRKYFPITQLSVRKTNIDDRSLPFISKMKKLFYIDFQESKVTDEGIMLLKDDLNIVSFDVKKLKGVTDKGLLHIIKTYPHLRLLSISSTNIGRNGFRQIPRLKELETLRAAALGVTDDDLSCLLSLPRLSGLELQSNPITDKSIPTLEKMKLKSVSLELTLIKQPGLEKLHRDLRGTKVTPTPTAKLDQDLIDLVK